MATIVTRQGKGSALTNAEVDANFTNLNTEVGGKQAALISGSNIKTINGQPVLGSGDLSVTGLPSQSGHAGKYLTTDGSTPSWSSISTGFFPFYKSDGSADAINLTSSSKVPFFNAGGSRVDIALAV